MLRALPLIIALYLPSISAAETMLLCKETAPFHPQRKTQWVQVSIFPGVAPEGAKAYLFLKMSHGVRLMEEEHTVRQIWGSYPQFHVDGPPTHTSVYTSIDPQSDFYLRIDRTGEKITARFGLTTWKGLIDIKDMHCEERQINTSAECGSLLNP